MPNAPILNGQVIGKTERATRAVLDQLLDDTGTSFDTWVTLKLLADNGPMTADALVDQLATGRIVSAARAETIVDDARAAGLITGTSHETAEFTELGRGRHQRISDGAAAIARRLYAGLPEDDLVVARRVLDTLAARARDELASH